MNFFHFLKQKTKRTSPFTINNLTLLIDLVINKADADKLKNFLSTQSSFTQKVEFHSQEIMDFMVAESICFYGVFDWKECSKELDYFIKKTLKQNFDTEINSNFLDNINDTSLIGNVYKLYGVELQKQGITLCNIDTGSDSYTILLIRTENYTTLQACVKEIGYVVQDYTMEW